MFGLTFATPYSPQHIDIASVMAVSAAISYADELMGSGISVTQELGVIYLYGMVSSVEMRDKAQEIADDVTHLPIRNRIGIAS